MSKGSEPAFAAAISDVAEGFVQTGLTKREVIAAMAMQGLISTLTISRTEYIELTTEVAVKYADALLTELAKEERW